MSSDLLDMNDLDENEKEKVYYLFGHDIRKIACFRSSMMASISASVATTLGSFLYTSDGTKSARLGLLTCSVLMLPLWLNCARKDLEDVHALQQARMRLKEKTGEEYTVLDSLESFGSDSYG